MSQAIATRRLVTGLVHQLSLTAITLLGVYYSGSLTLLAAALHHLSSAGEYGLSWFAANQSRKPAVLRNHSGLQRATLFSALAYSGILMVLAVFALVQGTRQLLAPVPANPAWVIGIGALALASSAGTAFHLWPKQGKSVHAHWRLVDDSIVSLAVLATGLAASVFGPAADGAGALLIAVVFLKRAWHGISEAAHIAAEESPEHVNPRELEAELLGMRGIKSVHGLRVWALGSQSYGMSVHAKTNHSDIGPIARLAKEIKTVLREKYGIEHANLEFEGSERKAFAQQAY